MFMRRQHRIAALTCPSLRRKTHIAIPVVRCVMHRAVRVQMLQPELRQGLVVADEAHFHFRIGRYVVAEFIVSTGL